jgi:thioredoxin 1
MKQFKKMSNKVKVYLFSAKEWCAGCRKLEPLFYDEVKKLGVKYEVVDVESDEGVELSIKYTVRNVPTLVFVKNGQEIGRETGSQAHLKIKNYL